MMRSSVLTSIVLTSLAAAAYGCSSDGGSTSSSSSGGGCVALKLAANQEFCDTGEAPLTSCSTTIHPGTKVEVCGAAVAEPPAELKRTDDTKEFAGTGAPEVGCFDPTDPSYPKAAGAPQMVTVEGLAKIFSHGDASTNLDVEFWTVKRTGGADDGMPDKLIGMKITTPSDCSTADTGVETKVGTEPNVTIRHECKYSYADVPTNTELLIVTRGDGWAPLYDFNIYIPDAEVQNGTWTHNVRALAADDYTVIPQAAIGHGITPGNGAIAGEVHDCGDVRVQNATVDTDAKRKILVYFTPDEDSPLPDQSANATTRLGLYSALDVPQGPVNVSAVGLVGGKEVTLGHFKAQIFPDSVTAVTFRGLRPFQLPKP
jgi:hypothetical protein